MQGFCVRRGSVTQLPKFSIMAKSMSDCKRILDAYYHNGSRGAVSRITTFTNAGAVAEKKGVSQ